MCRLSELPKKICFAKINWNNFKLKLSVVYYFNLLEGCFVKQEVKDASYFPELSGLCRILWYFLWYRNDNTYAIFPEGNPNLLRMEYVPDTDSYKEKNYSHSLWDVFKKLRIKVETKKNDIWVGGIRFEPPYDSLMEYVDTVTPSFRPNKEENKLWKMWALIMKYRTTIESLEILDNENNGVTLRHWFSKKSFIDRKFSSKDEALTLGAFTVTQSNWARQELV